MIVGAPWNLDWRNENTNSAYAANHVAFGGDVGFVSLENPTSWSPYFGVVAAHGVIVGYFDELQRETMGEAYMGSNLPWPLSGQAGPLANVALLELAEEAGFDVGGHLPAEPSPRMVFANPPSYSDQTDPIAAIGYP